MSPSNSDSVVVPLLNGQAQHGTSDIRSRFDRNATSYRLNSLCLGDQTRERRLSLQPEQSFKYTVRVLQLDHSQTWTSLVSWVVGLLLVVLVPVLRVYFVRTDSSDSSHELVFQPLVVIVGIALSLVSFLFLGQTIRKHGFRGVLFLDAAEEDIMEVHIEYEDVIKEGRCLLAKLFIPSFLIYGIFKIWFYSTVTLLPLPFMETMDIMSLLVIVVSLSLSWIFQTTTYLYACILFATVCGLQELKMTKFKLLLENGLDPEFYFYKYVRIMKSLQATSRRFRLFLALVLAVSILGFLASMYQVIEAERSGIDLLMSVEIVVLNLVNLSGVGLCLRSASKLSHLHRRIIKAAASMHATGTFEGVNSSFLGPDTNKPMECLQKLYQMQDGWTRRAALVTFLSSSSVGISVYGFVLDRFFIHACVGALLTTTWFILGRSLA